MQGERSGGNMERVRFLVTEVRIKLTDDPRNKL
jgi:hypothetical protein